MLCSVRVIVDWFGIVSSPPTLFIVYLLAYRFRFAFVVLPLLVQLCVTMLCYLIEYLVMKLGNCSSSLPQPELSKPLTCPVATPPSDLPPTRITWFRTPD